MTLIVVIPTGEGVIVASDAIAEVGGHLVPDRDKLRAVSPQTIVTASGTTDLYRRSESGAPTGPAIVATNDILSTEVTNRARPFITTAIVREAARSVARAVRECFALGPSVRDELVGLYICGIIVQFDPCTRRTLVGQFRVEVTPEGNVVTSSLGMDTVQPTDRRDFLLIGEADWVKEHVLSTTGAGHRFLPAESGSWTSGEMVQDVEPAAGARIARALIRATELTCDLGVPHEQRIGGEPVVLFLNGLDGPTAVQDLTERARLRHTS